MSLSNNYNFRNPVRHFINIDNIYYPNDISTFDPINELCWTKPMAFRIYKAEDEFRVIKMPNILNYVRAYHYYNGLDHFTDVMGLDLRHKRLAANLDTGDFVSGNYNIQLNDDFIGLCNYDVLIKLDISEYYGRIYTHYLDLEANGLNDKPLAWLNNGRTSGILMGNYLSLYFAEYLLSHIADDLQMNIDAESINCSFKYFSDDFYFFCNYSDIERILNIFDKVLSDYDFVRKNKKEVWTYETYNRYNLLTRLWKATIRAWNLEVLKDYEAYNKHPEGELVHKFSFLNQLVYRLDSLKDEKSKRSFIVNFFKTKHFQSSDYSKYKVNPYDLHQWFFLLKSAPESLLYVIHIINNIPNIKNDPKTKAFLKARYEEALKQELHDVQLYYYYSIKILGFEDVVSGAAGLVLQSQNQVLISYYLKDNTFTEVQKSTLKVITEEDYWFQNYHLILYTPSLKSDLTNSVKKYLIPKRLSAHPNPIKENRYQNFYESNISNTKAFINEIPDVLQKIKDYLELRHAETAEDFDV